MKHSSDSGAVAIVGVGAVLPGSPNVPALWKNLCAGRSAIVETPKDRWDPDKYWDPDPKAEDKSYTKIGGWVLESVWDPFAWRLPIPPKVADQMDLTQKWAIAAAREALFDFGYPDRPLDRERTGVIIGNAMGGDKHYYSAYRILAPESLDALARGETYQRLPESDRVALSGEMLANLRAALPAITEDTMPGELANIISGRIAAVFDLHGPNYVTDAACASAMAGMAAAMEGLVERHYDAVVAGGVDANMSPSSFVKFCKIGALSATGSRPYDVGADGFVMGEGAAMFLLKRLDDAERDGDRVYAVIRGIGGASDGKGKGITAPNPVGQRLAVQRGWAIAGERPDLDTAFEGHGTSTRVGDVVEVQALTDGLADFGLPIGEIPLGSIKSNIGHLKGAAGAAGILKATLSLHNRAHLPSIGLETPNPKIDFGRIPFFVNTEYRPWEKRTDGVRRMGVSAFGFGGTNFHAVLEEHEPGRLTRGERTTVSVVDAPIPTNPVTSAKAPPRGLVLLGGDNPGDLSRQAEALAERAARGDVPSVEAPLASTLNAPARLAVDFGEATELVERLRLAVKALASGNPKALAPLRARGIHLGQGPRPPVAFMYTGQGSQYVNMLAEFRKTEAVVEETIQEADRVMTPILGRPLSELLFVDPNDEEKMAWATEELRQTAVTQPAVLTVDAAMTRLLSAYGIEPDMVMGHSLGEYGALVAAGGISFAHALEAVAARGAEMTKVSVEDTGKMAAVMGPVDEVMAILDAIEGYVVVANLNSHRQAVIGGASAAVEEAVARCTEKGFRAQIIPVSHAFHTSIVAPASGPLQEVLRRLELKSVRIPLVGNVDGQFYPTGPDAPEKMVELLGRQIASPVQFVKGLETLYAAGARVFVEVGPKKALHGFAEDVLGNREDVLALFTNHPKLADTAAFNQALAGLYARGIGRGRAEPIEVDRVAPTVSVEAAASPNGISAMHGSSNGNGPSLPNGEGRRPTPSNGNGNGHGEAPRFGSVAPATRGGPLAEVGDLFARFMSQAFDVMRGASGGGGRVPVVISGASVGLPGEGPVFRDDNVARLLRGDQLIESIPLKLRSSMVERNISRLVKSGDGTGSFEVIDRPEGGLKLAGQPGDVRLIEDFGFPADRTSALDSTTELAIGAGIEALKDAGIPLVMHYKTTTRGTFLPERWMLPESMRDDTGVIFGAAFPGLDNFAREAEAFRVYRELEARRVELESLRARFGESMGATALEELNHRIEALAAEIEEKRYTLDRRFIFRILAMGHSQFAEYIGARGPNTHINAACASGTQGIGLAQDWIRSGRCKRVIVLSSDNVTSDALLPWIGSGFLATGAAATDDRVEDAALPFDKRRHGLLLGMGAAAVVVERADAVAERGLRPIAEVLGTRFVNSAFHGTRLNPEHITHEVEALVAEVEREQGISRQEIARQLVFVSHETYTPARGGSAQTEVQALRTVFGEDADKVVVANTKGMTGHAMGTGIEDILGVKALETGEVPPVPNFKEVDPELGRLNLSRGGTYPVEFALRLGAGFGSQLALTLIRRVPGERPSARRAGYAYRIADPVRWQSWLDQASGHRNAQVELVNRTLRVVDVGPADAMVLKAVTQQPSAGVPAAVPPAALLERAPEPRAEAGPGMQARAPAPPPVETPAPPPAPPVDPVAGVRARVLSIVSEQTGYPEDMLDPELDLEADLGIDTVKQAEMFAAVREAYAIERDPNLQLREFDTLEKVVGFVVARRPELAEAKPAAAPVPAATPAPSADPVAGVRARVLSIVSEQTGYPEDMLDPELDLEADLGIDTVKQAEMFAAVREAYAIERDPNLQLREFDTLEKVVGFVVARRPELAEVQVTLAPASIPAPSAPAGADPTAEVRARIVAIVAEQTGYPEDMLDPELDLEADLGIDTVKQAEMFAAVRESYGIERDPNLQLREFDTLEKVVGFVLTRRPELATVEAPAPSAAPGGAPAASAEDPSAAVLARILTIVSEQTGYPEDMLDPELDLEADLGIDTVKQAEMFAAVRESYGIERDPNLQLREFDTLAKVAGFVLDRRADLTATDAPAEAAVAGDEPAPSPVLEGTLDAASTIPRRVPTPVLLPSIEACKPTGVSLEAGQRVVVMSDDGGVSTALVAVLEARGVEVSLLESEPDDRQLAELAEQGPSGVFWLPALDDEGDFLVLSAEEFDVANRRRVKALHRVMQALYGAIDGPDRFLIGATRLGGRLGAGSDGATAPLGGSVSGFVKTYARERPESVVKVVDFAANAEAAAVAAALVEEATRDPGSVEVGRLEARRYTLGLEEISAENGGPPLELGEDSVLVVTGAAGSITSAIIADLVKMAPGATFYLLDLVGAPDPEDPDLDAFLHDRTGLQRVLAERIAAGGEKATPVKIERMLAGIERKVAARAAMQAVEAAGGEAKWHAVDLRDQAAVRDLFGHITAVHDRIDLLVHAGGLEISRTLPNKSADEFALVFDVKARGWQAALAGCGASLPRATVAFSSIAGRFGNGGQADYAAANDLLAKTSADLRRRGVRALVMDWTAWGGIGMATRGSIPKMMAQAGIDMLPPEAGIAFIRRELTVGGRADEVVVAQGLGILVAPRDETGGLVPTELGAVGPMVERLVRFSADDGFGFEVTLDPSKTPFLDDHRIDGMPVLPGVMGMEAFAEAATIAAKASAGGAWSVVSLEDVAFSAPFKFYKDEPRVVRVDAKLTAAGDGLIAECKLVGRRRPAGLDHDVETVCFTGRVRLERTPRPDMPAEAVPDRVRAEVPSEAIYGVYFHGPAYQVLGGVMAAEADGMAAVGPVVPQLPQHHDPERGPTVLEPRLIEACFQAEGVRTMARTGTMALPAGVERLSWYAAPDGRSVAVVEDAEPGQPARAWVCDEKGRTVLRLDGYRTVVQPGAVEPERLSPFVQAFGGGAED